MTPPAATGLSDEQLRAIEARCQATHSCTAYPRQVTRDLLDLLDEVRRLRAQRVPLDPTAQTHSAAQSTPSALRITSGSETRCTAIAWYSSHPGDGSSAHRLSATLLVGGVPGQCVRPDARLGLEVEHSTEQGDHGNLLISETLAVAEVEALVAVLVALREQAEKAGVLPPGAGTAS